MARKQTPRLWVTALIATTAVAASYEFYKFITKEEEAEEEVVDKPHLSRRYTNKSIALTLLHSVLRSDLPLNEILLNSENVTFILPPYLLVDDLECSIAADDASYSLPQTLIKNYKLLKCANIQGYFHILKNLKPDMLFVCSDDLGITQHVPKDLGRFVKEIVTIGQNKEDVSLILSKVFLR